MDDFEKELKLDFLNEATDLLEKTEAAFLNLETQYEDAQLLDTIFRFAHNLKGTSRAVGFGEIAEITHKAENVILLIKEKKLKVNSNVVNILLHFNDAIKLLITGLKLDLSFILNDHSLIQDLESLSSGDVSKIAQVEKIQTVLADTVEPQVEDSSVSANIDQTAASFQGSISESSMVLTDQAKKDELSAQKKNIVKKEREDETIRVSLGRLEQLGDLVGELVILQSVVDRSLSLNPSDLKTARALSKLCKNIQDLSMSLRMVPLTTTFQKLQRTVRDTSKTLNKKIKLQLIGEETEIDKTVLEHLGDPLVHIIRNAIDHGVELPEERVSAGKNEEGTVEVLAFHEGNYLVIQITDDGKGIDPEKLKKKAIEKGLMSSTAKMTEQEALHLIFHPGFSTKDQVSEVSGRGVGMDVVKTNIESIGGEVRVKSKVGVGSSFRLMIPLTLAIIDGIHVIAGGQNLIIPKNQVHEINQYSQKDIRIVAGKTPLFKLREEVMPIFNLSQDMGSKNPQNTIVVIVKMSAASFAVALEDVLRQQQIVVKPPTKEIAGKKGMMGTTILCDGMPALILDLVDMYSKNLKQQEKALAA
jgi:two-component system chemotaxis sensor kinase CheA